MVTIWILIGLDVLLLLALVYSLGYRAGKHFTVFCIKTSRHLATEQKARLIGVVTGTPAKWRQEELEELEAPEKALGAPQ